MKFVLVVSRTLILPGKCFLFVTFIYFLYVTFVFNILFIIFYLYTNYQGELEDTSSCYGIINIFPKCLISLNLSQSIFYKLMYKTVSKKIYGHVNLS